MRIIISNRSGIPIYEQITTQIKEAIFSGELSADELLPSIRQLAKDLKISVITTTRAYNDLETEGFIVTMPGKGSYVLPSSTEMMRENALFNIESAFSEAVAAAKQSGLSKSEIMQIFELLCKEENYA